MIIGGLDPKIPTDCGTPIARFLHFARKLFENDEGLLMEMSQELSSQVA